MTDLATIPKLRTPEPAVITIIVKDKLTPAALARLKRNEAAQRAATKRRGLPVEFVSVEGLWLLQQGRCCCPNCNRTPMDPEAVGQEPDAPTIAHVYLRKRGGGHTIENVRLWRFACNAEMARTERHDTALGDRMAVDLTKKTAPQDAEAKSPRKLTSRSCLGGGKIQGRGFDKSKTRGFDGRVRERT